MRLRVSIFIRLLALGLIAALLPAAARAGEPQCRLDAYGLSMTVNARPTLVRASIAKPLNIVAIGSSSTAGAGASSPDRAYPAQLQLLLSRHWPQRQVRVINRGVNGEEAADMIRRFGDHIVAAAPDLVIWQVGTNYLMRHEGVGGYAATLRDGLDRLKRAGVAVILMDPQYAPRVLADPDHEVIVELIARIAREEGVPLFPRFRLMGAWSAAGAAWPQMLTPDMLHLNDWAYGCIAQALAQEIIRLGPN